MDESKRETLLTLGPGRSDLYLFLASAFVEPPSDELLRRIGEDAFLVPLASIFREETVRKLRELGEAGSIGALKERLDREFTSLFRCSGERYVAPFESAYRDLEEPGCHTDATSPMGRCAGEVQAWYDFASVELSSEFADSPDHIALELNYLALLCANEEALANAAPARLTRVWEMERDFLAGHVVRWVGSLRDRIYENTEHPYVTALGDMAVEFTARDLATLEDALGASLQLSVPQYKDT
ncbi:MAG: molecular chaperone TorD family protein [Phycisphaerae bacterium]